MFSFLLLFALLGSPAPTEDILYEDYAYDSQIKTIRLFPAAEDPEVKLLPSVTSLNGGQLLLEFDDLQGDRVNYYAKIISCNYDWTKSTLHDLDFLENYNEFNIDDYEYSSNTLVPYVHYRFLIPPVKIPGNYVVVVYRDGDLEQLALSKRFMVSSDVVTVIREANYGMSAFKANNQQINFTMNYNGVDIPNPLETVNVVIRQNQRWDNAQWNIKPSFVREASKTLEYRFFNTDKSFRGGNEFRFVDFTSINYPGQNTDKLERTKAGIKLSLVLDAPRDGQRYAQYRDLNGGFVIQNRDAGGGESTSNYLNVIFSLQSAQRYNSDVFVIGAFNNWRLEPNNKMKYEDGIYQSEIQLKQGFYNYAYITSNPAESIEGSYFETENFYEIFVYNKSIYPSADMLIGYYSFVVNPR
jgi:hypothetical protein